MKYLKHNHKAIFPALFLLAVSLCLPAQAQRLYGGVTVNESLASNQKSMKKMDGAKYDLSANTKVKRDCICFDRNRVELKQIDGRWKLIDGDHWILDFDANENNARQSLKVVQAYNLDEICFIGRNTARPMMYFLSDGQAPQGKLDGEDAISFDTKLVKAEEINGNWKLTCGNMWMEDFGQNKECAQEAAETIKYHGFTKQCFVGRPGPPMEYFAK